jgi:hypothetical protein
VFNNKYLPKFAFHTVLHGEERLHMIAPTIKANTQYQVEIETIDVLDKGKGKGAFLVERISGYELDGKGGRTLAYYVDRVTYAKTLGGSDVKATGKFKPLPNPPKREPDM